MQIIHYGEIDYYGENDSQANHPLQWNIILPANYFDEPCYAIVWKHSETYNVLLHMFTQKEVLCPMDIP